MAGKRKYNPGDLIGKNNVQLIRYVEKNQHRQWKCEFKCTNCDNTFIVGLNAVSNGNSHLCEKCKHEAAKNRGKQVGKQSYYKDYTKTENPFYLFISPLEKKDNDGIRYWKIQCKKCGKFYEERPVYLISNIRRRGNNPCECWKNKKNSKGVLLIKKVLEYNKIKYITEHYFKDCLSKNNNYLYFDFYLPDYNCCIEYDGEQHFQPIEIFGGEQRFKEQQILDSIKNQYCKEHNIKLIRIPYTDYNKINYEYLKQKGAFSE